MIRASNIDVDAHTCDLSCDHCGESEEGVNVNTGLEYSQEQVVNEAVGTGDGSTTVFNLDHTQHVLVNDACKVYVEGTEQTRPDDYDVTTAGVVTFVSAPASDEAITADYEHKDGGSIVTPCPGATPCGASSWHPRVGGGANDQLLASAKTE